jgi:hypothetical protein
MAKRTSSRKKIPTAIWAALIALVGVIITALLGSPILLRLIENRPAGTSMAEGIGLAPGDSSPATAADCEPLGIAALPPETVAVVETLAGATARIPLDSLRYEYKDGLTLASGVFVKFDKMQRFELSNPDFASTFSAEITITLLDCSVHQDIIRPGSDSNLTGATDLGDFDLYILEVMRVVFEHE